jgi:hypothetical protein
LVVSAFSPVESSMDSARRWIVPFVLACAFGGDASCLGSDGPVPGPSRELDRACKSGGCVLSGEAILTTGPTADTVGIHMGSGASTATITLTGVTVGTDSQWHFELLVAGSGTFTASEAGCTPSPDGAIAVTIHPQEDYAWVRASSCSDRPATVTSGTVTVTGTDGSTMDIADIRTYAPRGCGEY